MSKMEEFRLADDIEMNFGALRRIERKYFILKLNDKKKLSNLFCYESCSKINPHLASTCDNLGNYYSVCPTNRRLNGGSKQ